MSAPGLGAVVSQRTASLALVSTRDDKVAASQTAALAHPSEHITAFLGRLAYRLVL